MLGDSIPFLNHAKLLGLAARLVPLLFSCACTVLDGYLFTLDTTSSSSGSGGAGASASGGGGVSGTGASAGSGGRGGGGFCLASDDFDGARLNRCWRDRDVTEGDDTYEALELNGEGQLEIVPSAYTRWIFDGTAPFLYQMAEGNFAVQVLVESQDRNLPANPPPDEYHGGGLMIRSRAHVEDQDFTEYYVQYDLGTQGGLATGTDVVSTSMNVGDPLVDGWPYHRGILLMCRTSGDFVHVARRQEGAGGFGDHHVFPRPDMTGPVQVGVQAHCPDGIDDTRVVFEWIRFTPLEDTVGDGTQACLTAFDGQGGSR